MKKLFSLAVCISLIVTCTYAQSGNIGIGTTTPTSKLQINGSLATGYRLATASTTLTGNDYTLEYTGTAAATITLPDATTCNGRAYMIKNTSATSPTPMLTVSPVSAQTIDGQAAWLIETRYELVTLVSDGINWTVFGQQIPTPLTDTTGGAWLQGGNSDPALSARKFGTLTNTSIPIITNNTQRMLISNTGNIGIGTAVFDSVNPEQLVINTGASNSVNAIVGKGSVTNYFQLNVQNQSSSNNSSSDVVATADNGNETTNYVDLGINSSTNSANIFGNANDAYLYNMSNNFLIGTGNPGKALCFLTAGTSQATNERMRIDSAGRVGIGTNAPAYKLDVNGTIRTGSASTTSGSLVFSNSTNANTVTLNSGATTTSYALTLPAAQGAASTVLTNNGSGVLTWAAAAAGTGSGSGWSLTGNSGTTPGTNFIGTTDNQSLVLKANNTQAGKIDLPLQNASFGYQSALSMTTGTNSTYMGYQAGYYNTSGASNTGLGGIALLSNTTGSNNTGVGQGALASNTTGSGNTSVGSNSSRFSTTATNNVAVGQSALAYATTASANTAVGAYSMQSTTTGGSNTALGYNSLASNTTGTNNTTTGMGSLELNTTGTYNTSLGYNAGFNTATGSYNTTVGTNAGGTNTSGSNLTLLGANADVSSGALTEATAIGYNAKVAASYSMVLGGTGADAVNVGIGTSAPANTLTVVSAANPLYLGGLQNGAGSDSLLSVLNGVVRKVANPGSPIASGWSLTGNSGTTPGTNFIGTTDNQSLVFKVNNVLSGKIDQTLNNASYGYQCAMNMSTGTNCTYIGYQAGYGNTSGPSNTGIGSIALNANTTGSNNTAVGMGALGNNTTGSGNTSLGTSALRYNTTATNNVAVGNSALAFATTANSNTAVGAYSLQSTTTGGSNTAQGYSSLAANTTGTGNTATGAGAVQANTSGINNTGLGNGALQLNTTGNNNAAAGAFALQDNTTGIYNSALGYGALGINTTGNYNVAIGNSAGATNTTGLNNTLIGSNADVSSAALSNATAIGYYAKVGESNAIVLGGTGSYAVNVGIGTTTPGNFLEINSGTGGASGLRLKELPAGAVLFMSSTADVAQNNNNFYFDAVNYRLGITAGTSPNSTLTVGGSLAVGMVTKTASYTAGTSDHTILCNNTSGSISITLPMASGATGRIYVVKKISAAGNNVVVQHNGSGTDLIDGASSVTLLNQYDTIMIQSDGTNWDIMFQN